MLRSTRSIAVGILLVSLVMLALWWGGSDGDPTGPADVREEGGTDGAPRLRGGKAGSIEAGRAGPATAVSEDGAPDIPPWPIGSAPEHKEGTGRVYVLLVDSRGQPLADHAIEVSWWKAFAVMGDDGGTTDAQGRFRTSADEAWHLESVSVPTGETASHLYHPGPFAASPDRPYEVRVGLPAGGLIRGRALDSTGAPRAGVLVEAEDLSSLPADPFAHPMRYNGSRVTSDAEGAFSLPAVLGRHEVRLRSPKLRAVSELRVHLTAARPIVDVVLRTMEPIRGRAVRVTISGSAPEGTRVSAYADTPVFGSAQRQDGVEEIVQRTRRPGRRLDDGIFEVEGIQGDGWRIVVSVPGAGRRAVGRHELPAGATEITVTLPEPLPELVQVPARTVRIVARRPDGTTTPPDVYVLRSYDLGELDNPGDHTRKNGETHVRLEDRDGEVYLLVAEAGHAYVAFGPLRSASAPERVEVQLQRAGAAYVEIVDGMGRPVPAELTLQPAWSFFRSVVNGQVAAPGRGEGYRSVSLHQTRVGTGTDGRATFKQLGSEPWQVTARPTDEKLPSARGVLRAGETLRMVLGEGYSDEEVFHGRVVDFVRRSPLADIRVEAVTDDTEEGYAWATVATADDGTFTLRGLPARRTRFRVFGEGWAFPKNATLDLATTPAPLVFALHASRRLPVLVVDGAGVPIHAALVSFAWPDGTPITTQDQYGNMGDEAEVTDIGGRVDLLGLPAARIVLLVTRSGEPAESASRHEIDLSDPVRKLVTLRDPR